jgi:hypothetical protein
VRCYHPHTSGVATGFLIWQVTVLEMRTVFSRVNILTLWPQTADDLMGFGAKLFYPR